MLTLKKLKVRGFRGFRGDEAFAFDSPATLLFGENHCGKSSTLNAVEWALFGDDCAGKQTGIRERVGWEIANRHMEAPDVLAEVALEGPDGIHVVRRTLKKSGRKAAVEGLELTDPDGTVLTGQEAGQRLARLLGCSFRDFLTTVYQHQEAIRALLTQEPRERNDAIDRLLGLSAYRNLLDGINAAKVSRWHKDLSAAFEVFGAKVQTALTTRERDLEERRQAAARSGIAANQLNEKAALRLAAEVRQALTDFAAEAGVGVRIGEVPRTGKHLEAFEKATRMELNRLRGELPDLREQQELFSRQSETARLKGAIEKVKDLCDALGRDLGELDRQHGGRQAVAAQLRTLKDTLDERRRWLRETDARAALVHEAITYLEKTELGAPAGRCPVCEGPAPNLLQTLRRQAEQLLRAQVATIGEEIQSLEARLGALQEVAAQYKDGHEQRTRHAAQLAEYRGRAGEQLGQALTDRDDPLPLLNGELSRIDHRLKQLARAVQAKQARLDEIAGRLEKVRLVREILQGEEKKQTLEQIQESAAYQELAAVRDRAAELVADLDGIKEAIGAVSHEEARDRLAAAEGTIDRYFRRLTRHPAVTRFRLALGVDARTGRNAYGLTDKDGRDLVPVLSQGDLNALALAMFLGLACSAAGAGAFGFVMLDDPSQSLGSEAKEELVAVLNEVSASKRLVLATMDREFRDCWREGLTRARTEYLFEGWTPEDGPSIRRPG